MVSCSFLQQHVYFLPRCTVYGVEQTLLLLFYWKADTGLQPGINKSIKLKAQNSNLVQWLSNHQKRKENILKETGSNLNWKILFMCLLICNQWSVEKEKTGKQPYGFSAAEAHLAVSTLVFTQAATTTAGPSNVDPTCKCLKMQY